MKIAIASTAKNEKGEISQRGGRAPYYLIFDETGNLEEAIKNPVEQGGGGVGPYIAKLMADKEVTIFIAEKVGANMIAAFEEYGIEYKKISGDVISVVEKFYQ